MQEQEILLEVRHLKKYFTARRDWLGRPAAYVKAVDGISFTLSKGETLGLVGESGCGKSTAGRTLLQLYRPTAGQVLFKGRDIAAYTSEKELRRDMQMVFQDPYASLNPRMTIGDIIGEPLDIHGLAAGKARSERIDELLSLVGLAAGYRNRYPHEFSGGQRQRVGIARALAVNPGFIVCDEPISALDVSIQAQIVNLLERLQADLGLTYLFIAHDLAMVKHMSSRIAVMYLGKLVELAPSSELYKRPQHPYTQALLSAIPKLASSIAGQRLRLSGEIPSPVNPPPGCRFHTRCRHAMPVCRQQEPVLTELIAGHFTACHLYKLN
ncbi:ABC transporter ATP-binding protein [Propionispora hippei]|uniref:Oligopeptide transport system ATP-binding protein n=1 Tax=Propionispora hippei DSM 15287 TaxID=1123003 RepID=A0A1M6BVT1_9FIRM|nr:oligopeptide/dipeptide ABC transporter ATP-binding protein [Propionispora hippei]SHI52870.1 oligopeptide transport system ATP-binding protein [Propionispora hippei DSM 15287]